MLTIEIQNDGTGKSGCGNYDYRVRINNELIQEGRIENHPRVLGWVRLVEKLVQVGERDRCLKGLARVAEYLADGKVETKPEPVEWR